MSYNKARAEKEWLKWKEAEEKKLRELGVDEDTIQRLHTYDWEEFKKERRFWSGGRNDPPMSNGFPLTISSCPLKTRNLCWTASKMSGFSKRFSQRTSLPSRSSC